MDVREYGAVAPSDKIRAEKLRGLSSRHHRDHKHDRKRAHGSGGKDESKDHKRHKRDKKDKKDSGKKHKRDKDKKRKRSSSRSKETETRNGGDQEEQASEKGDEVAQAGRRDGPGSGGSSETDTELEKELEAMLTPHWPPVPVDLVYVQFESLESFRRAFDALCGYGRPCIMRSGAAMSKCVLMWLLFMIHAAFF